MSPEQGRIVYDHVRATRPAEVLELGTAHGVGAAYLAAALEDNGAGRLTTVDFEGAAYDPAPEAVLARAGVAGRVAIVRRFSSYTWWLKEQVQARSDRAGNVEPVYDFVYLDGAKNWTIDGLAVGHLAEPDHVHVRRQHAALAEHVALLVGLPLQRLGDLGGVDLALEDPGEGEADHALQPSLEALQHTHSRSLA